MPGPCSGSCWWIRTPRLAARLAHALAGGLRVPALRPGAGRGGGGDGGRRAESLSWWWRTSIRTAPARLPLALPPRRRRSRAPAARHLASLRTRGSRAGAPGGGPGVAAQNRAGGGNPDRLQDRDPRPDLRQPGTHHALAQTPAQRAIGVPRAAEWTASPTASCGCSNCSGSALASARWPRGSASVARPWRATGRRSSTGLAWRAPRRWLNMPAPGRSGPPRRPPAASDSAPGERASPP